MVKAPERQAELVTDSARFAALAASLTRAPAVAIDTESNSFHRYPERVCLVQLFSGDRCYVIDPLAVHDMSPLGALLAAPKLEKIVHSADYDLRSLDREWGFRVRNLYDTSVAAHFVGLGQRGLGSAVEHYLGVTLDKGKRLQRADWSLRPLSEEALTYAANDVAYLPQLRDILAEKVEALGRTAWVQEECKRLEEVRYAPPPPPELACLTMKGASALDGGGLAVLQRLARLREDEARLRGRPPFRVLSDETLVHLAAKPAGDPREAPGVSEAVMHRLGGKLKQALRQGMAARPVDRRSLLGPARPRPSTQEADRLKRLRAWRQEQAARLSLDPALVWPMASLERLARSPQALETELNSLEVRRWQAAQFGASLKVMLAALERR